MGLAGETGEVLDIFKKARRDQQSVDLQHVKEEIGDVCWYIANLCTELGWTIEEVLEYNMEKIRRKVPYKMIKRIFNKESILVMLYMCFAAALVTSNVVAAKMFDLQFEAFGGSVMFNVGTFCYAITLLIANVISYLYGKQKSQIAIAGGFVAQILSTLLVVLLRYVPSTSQVSQDAYVTILGQNYIFVIGSLIAYVFCQLTNNYVFNKLLSKINKKGTKGAWNFISNILGQLN